ncbi:acetylglucosamine-6-sulfatase [Bacteroidia bacterium]|nr:acetylglucosamine-6-sulfatase [Bacteroidia bacterium]
MRNFICLPAAMALALPGLSAREKQPNILFILTDDQRWDALGYAGNPYIHTPNLDRLAQQGVYFKNSFVTTPLSGASRASILTGLYERTGGYTFGVGDIPKDLLDHSYPVLLHDAGYYTGFYGKFGVNYPAAELKKYFDKIEVLGRSGPKGYFYKTIDGDTVHLTDYMGWSAEKFLRSAPKDKPFCLSLSFNAPHAHDKAVEQYFWPKTEDHLYRDVIMPDALISEEKYFLAQPEYVREGINRERWFWRYDTPEKYQHSIKGYYRMISGVDRVVGQIREVLRQTGQGDNTVIIFMGDNGYFEGERQLAGKWLMYDNSLRVPLIIYDPRGKGHRDVEQMALNIDIAPTILNYCGVAVPQRVQGLDLGVYTTSGKGRIDRDKFLCEHRWATKLVAASEGIRTEGWKYFRYCDHPGSEHLYELTVDPLEVNNLAGDPRYAKKLEELRRQCDELIAAGLRERTALGVDYNVKKKKK